MEREENIVQYVPTVIPSSSRHRLARRVNYQISTNEQAQIQSIVQDVITSETQLTPINRQRQNSQSCDAADMYTTLSIGSARRRRCRPHDIQSFIYETDSETDNNETEEYTVDVSNGRIRPLRRNHNNMRSEWQIAELERDILRAEILMLREQQQQAARGLAHLRLEQFRLRHQQMMSLFQLVFQYGSQLQQDDDHDTIQELRSQFSELSEDLIAMMEGYMDPLNNSIDESTTGTTTTTTVESFDRLIDMIQRMSVLENETEQRGATETQLATLNLRPAKKDDICAICMKSTNPQDHQASLNCKHWHCQSCLIQWLIINNACPVCRSAIN